VRCFIVSLELVSGFSVKIIELIDDLSIRLDAA